MLAEAVNSAALATALNDTNDNTKLIRIELRKLKKVHFGSLLDNAPKLDALSKREASLYWELKNQLRKL